jgi:antitoxin component of MazEF toxin-antitoxin module
MKLKLRKIGNSRGVIIPYRVVALFGRDGTIDIGVYSDGKFFDVENYDYTRRLSRGNEKNA